ncbi:TPA: hypothetical protein ACQFAS_004620, partial [Escherichia coli]
TQESNSGGQWLKKARSDGLVIKLIIFSDNLALLRTKKIDLVKFQTYPSDYTVVPIKEQWNSVRRP